MARRPSPLKRERTQRAEEIRAQYTEVAGTRETLPFNQINARVNGDTRELNEQHVIELMESVEILGLISPLTIDREGTLLAGGHRRAAIQKLAELNPSRYKDHFGEGVPVYRLDLIASEAPVEALQVEIEENTQRRNYTAEEVKTAAKKLEAAGYEKLKGRPREGQKSLKRALQRIFKLSDRRIQSILNTPETDPQRHQPHPINAQSVKTAKKRAVKHLYGLESQLSQWSDSTPAHQDALRKIREALEALNKL